MKDDVDDFELKISPEFLEKANSDLKNSIEQFGGDRVFEAYNRGGGPKGAYDRHYDKSTR